MTETSFAGTPAPADMTAGTDEVAAVAFGNSEVAPPAVTSAAGSFDNGERRAPAVPAGNSNDRLDLLGNVEMDVTAELGRTRMTVRELLSLAPGTVVELDRAAGSPVDLFVNGTLIARGEVVVVDEEFGVRISEIVSYDGGTNANQTGRA